MTQMKLRVYQGSPGVIGEPYKPPPPPLPILRRFVLLYSASLKLITCFSYCSYCRLMKHAFGLLNCVFCFWHLNLFCFMRGTGGLSSISFFSIRRPTCCAIMWFWHRWFTKEGWQIRRQNVIAMVYMDSTPSELFEVFIAASLLDTLVKPCR